MNVWKITKTEYYTRVTKRPNQFGRLSSPCFRKVTHWAANINGRVVEGFATKRQALAAIAEQEA